MDNPMVSVVMITYNHEEFIEKSILNILSQECNFEFDLLIADDNSKDRTESIIRKIIAEHPKAYKIKYIRHEQNIGMSPNFVFALNSATGKYIAICEGDDYWITNDKLQTQVDFLEANPDHILSAGAYIEVSKDAEKVVVHKSLKAKESDPLEDYTFNMSDFDKRWLIKTLNIVFRNNKDVLKDFSRYKLACDTQLYYHLMLTGKGRYHVQPSGVYNVHGGGVWSSKSQIKRANTSYNIHKEFNQVNKTSFSKRKFLKSALKKLRMDVRNSYEGNNFSNKKRVFIEVISNIRTAGDFVLALKIMLKKQAKA